MARRRFLAQRKIPIYACGTCARARNVRLIASATSRHWNERLLGSCA